MAPSHVRLQQSNTVTKGPSNTLLHTKQLLTIFRIKWEEEFSTQKIKHTQLTAHCIVHMGCFCDIFILNQQHYLAILQLPHYRISGCPAAFSHRPW